SRWLTVMDSPAFRHARGHTCLSCRQRFSRLWRALPGVGRSSRHPRFRSPLHRQVAASSLNTELLAQCDQRFRNATLDHFNWGPGDLNATTYSQRYFVCGEQRQPSANGLPGPIFLYLGNEADVTLYLNNTGLMWE
ncbi:predicted protein, partial [Haematococcus lacustris]